jgi:hypothetical protein
MASPRRLFGRLYLRLDTSETPAMVFVQSRGRTVDSGTYWCVMQEGFDSLELTPAEYDWLLSLEDTVDAHMNTIPVETR